MAADFNTDATIRGTKEEVFAILKVMHRYTNEMYEQYRVKRNCPYLMSLDIYGDGEDEFGMSKQIDGFSDEELLAYIEEKNCVIHASASGPYGVFGLLDEVGLFREMAEAAPNAYFIGSMYGFNPGGDQAADFELKDGLLYCKSKFPEDDWGEDEEDFEDEDYDDEDDWDDESIYDPVKKQWFHVDE